MNDDIPKIDLKEWVDIRIQRGDDIPSIEDEINWIDIIYDAETYMTFYVARPAHLLGEVYDEVMTERMIINTNYTPLSVIIDPQNCKSVIEYIKRLTTL